MQWLRVSPKIGANHGLKIRHVQVWKYYQPPEHCQYRLLLEPLTFSEFYWENPVFPLKTNDSPGRKTTVPSHQNYKQARLRRLCCKFSVWQIIYLFMTLNYCSCKTIQFLLPGIPVDSVFQSFLKGCRGGALGCQLCLILMTHFHKTQDSV